MWTACVKAAVHPVRNWLFPGDIHFLLLAGHGLPVSSTHRYRYRSRQWITTFSASQEMEKNFSGSLFCTNIRYLFSFRLPWLLLAGPGTALPGAIGALACDQPCFWWRTRTLEASLTIQSFVHQDPSVPVMVQGFQLTGITATEQEYRFGIRIQLVSILNEQY